MQRGAVALPGCPQLLPHSSYSPALSHGLVLGTPWHFFRSYVEAHLLFSTNIPPNL